MKLSNERILRDITALAEIAKKELPVKVSYAIAKNISKIEKEFKLYDKEREKLIDKYAEKDNDGKVIIGENNQFKIKSECTDAWSKDIRELLDIENDIDIYKFKIDELNGYYMTPTELMLIEYMIEE